MQAPCGLLTASADGSILYANDTFCRWLGYERDQLVGRRKVADLLTIGARLFQQTHWGPLLQLQRSVAELKLELVRCDGARLPMLVNASRSESAGGDIDRFAFMVVNDRHKFEIELLQAKTNAERALEAKRQAESELKKASDLKDQFLATLAHELRNPLAPMSNVLALLQDDVVDTERLRWAREVLQRQLAQLSHLVDDLLDVARFNEGKIELRKRPLDLADMMRAAVEASGPRIEAASHRLTVELPSSLTVDADPTRLLQIMQNLLNNAVKYTPPGGDVMIAGYRDGDEAVFTVRDSGIGISPENIGSVFGMFVQLGRPKGYSDDGLGVGLALVKMLVDLHGGKVEAHSEGPGKGSRFTVSLPMCESETSEQATVEPGAAPMPRRILVVDDNRDAAESLAAVLEVQGNTVSVASDAAAALTVLDNGYFDAAVLDIGLPDMSGYELARRIRSKMGGARLTLIALTGWGQQEDKTKAFDAGFDVHFTKPVDVDELCQALGTPDGAPDDGPKQ
ncbi:ATP-binding protein [Caballeronia sp. GAFFF1]|uniref:hybrid sensor histidine kinase/response regulator n=1 Tax=Caballeronia sp. GAFFF1 TaxID=2921779 RepID=UPI00202885B1|nr:ATP-binding protein [Caballeronia sp. GAFFF1]